MSADTLRQVDLQTLATALNDQRTRALDVVADARSLTVEGGALILRGTEAVLSEDGVSSVDGRYVPTTVGDEGLAEKLGIPTPYLRRLRSDAPDLYDANVGGWLARDERRFMLRLLRGGDVVEAHGVLRAFLSDSYRTVDNFDVLLAALEGMREAGVSEPRIQADLTDRRMYVRVTVPEIAAYAPDLLAGYRSPFDGGAADAGGWTPDRVAHAAAGEGSAYVPGSEPIVFGGFVITNSETGNGGYNLTPRLEVKVCANGLTIAADAQKKIHLGPKLDTGVVRASDRTLQANLELVKAQTADAVRTFLDVDYVQAKIREMEKSAGVKVTDPQKTIATVSKQLGFTKDQQAEILNHFVVGGQLTAGGVMQAVTSVAQTLADGDAAWDMEAAGLPALEMAAAEARR